jgi:hypothetical protein
MGTCTTPKAVTGQWLGVNRTLPRTRSGETRIFGNVNIDFRPARWSHDAGVSTRLRADLSPNIKYYMKESNSQLILKMTWHLSDWLTLGNSDR